MLINCLVKFLQAYCLNFLHMIKEKEIKRGKLSLDMWYFRRVSILTKLIMTLFRYSLHDICINKNQTKSSCQINDWNYGEAFEARSKCFAPVPNHPTRLGLAYFIWKIQSLSRTTYEKSTKLNTVDRNKKREQTERKTRIIQINNDL